MDLINRVESMGFELIDETPEGMIFKRNGIDKKIIVIECDKLKFEEEVKLFKIWKEKEVHPFAALSNGKFFDLIFDEVIDII